MKNQISWKERLDDRVKREVRVTIWGNSFKWQYKRADEERWDYNAEPTTADWDALEDILLRRAGRGRAVTQLETVRKYRSERGIK